MNHFYIGLIFSPVFDGLFDFCSMYTGASLEAAVKLNNNVSGIFYFCFFKEFLYLVLLKIHELGFFFLI